MPADAYVLAADALRQAAAQRRRAAERFAGEVRSARLSGEVKDPRTQAVRIMELLGEASVLEDVAAALGGGQLPLPLDPSPLQEPDTSDHPGGDASAGDDDDTSGPPAGTTDPDAEPGEDPIEAGLR